MHDSSPSGKSVGTGVIISETGSVVTNAHVISNNLKVANVKYLSLKCSKKYYKFKKIRYVNHQSDLAILRLDIKRNKIKDYIGLSEEAINMYDKIYIIGNPSGYDGNPIKQAVTFGKINHIAEDNNLVTNQSILKIGSNAPVEPGSSGSPIMLKGQIVGFVSHGDVDPPSSFGIHSKEIHKAFQYLKNLKSKKSSIPEDLKKWNMGGMLMDY